MNRRRFLQLLGLTGAAAAAPVGELWIPGKKSIFLPPRGGWASSRPDVRLDLLNFRVDMQREAKTLYGIEQFPLLFAPGPARLEVSGALRGEEIERVRPGDIVEIKQFPGFAFRVEQWQRQDYGLGIGSVRLSQVQRISAVGA